MKKNIAFILVLALISAAAWMSCQKIDDPLVITSQREFPDLPDDTTGGDTTVNPPNFISTFVDYKQVLLEEFTGHLCVNCPEAAKMAHDLAEEVDHKLIIYAVHAGNFAAPIPNSALDADFTCDVGDELFPTFGIYANPLALIDRVKFNGLRQIATGDWETVVTDQLQEANTVNLKLSNTWYPSLGAVAIDIETTFLGDPEGQYKLAVYIVEDSIVAPQLNNNPNIGDGGDTLYNYVHRNILRDAVSPYYGDFLGVEGNVVAGEVYTKSYTYPLNGDWVTKNCRIIAYIGKSDPALNLVDIVQVAELEIKVGE